jgi:hypothetical protein
MHNSDYEKVTGEAAPLRGHQKKAVRNSFNLLQESARWMINARAGSGSRIVWMDGCSVEIYAIG